MKKSLFILFILPILAFSVENDLQKTNLRGLVKTRIIEYYRASSDGGVNSTEDLAVMQSKTIENYNREGYLTKEVKYNALGWIDWEAVYHYEGKNLMIKYTHYKEDGSVYFKYAIGYKYNNKEQRIEQTDYDGNGKAGKETKYIYNETGLLVQTIRDKNGEPYWKKEYKYNAEGEKIEMLTTFADASLKEMNEKTNFKYNKQGNMVEETNYRADGTLFSKRVYTYRGDSSAPYKNVYITYDFDGKEKNTRKDIYNSRGLLEDESDYDPKNILVSKTKYQYKFDENDNIVEKEEYRSSDTQNPEKVKIYSILNFKFEYYE